MQILFEYIVEQLFLVLFVQNQWSLEHVSLQIMEYMMQSTNVYKILYVINDYTVLSQNIAQNLA